MTESTTVIRKEFSFDVTLQSVYKEPDGTMHVIGVASDDGEDRTGDRMSTKAIHSMAEQCTKSDLPLLDNHRSTFGFGYTHSGQARRTKQTNKDGVSKTLTELVVDFVLDSRFPQAHVLYEEVEAKKSQKQLSIGGFLNTENPKAIRFEENDKGQTVRVIEDITLEHIASTRPKFAAMPRARFLDAIIKDIFGQDEPHDEALDKTNQEEGMADQNQQTSGTAVAEPQTPQNQSTSEENLGTKTAPQTSPEIDPGEMAEAAKAMKRLAQIGKMFATEEKPAPEVSKEVQELEQIAEKAVKVQGLTEKDFNTVRRIHSALGKLLNDDGATGQDPETTKDKDTTPADIAMGSLSDEDVQRIAEAVAKSNEDLRTGQQQMTKVFDETFTAMATKVGEGLEGMALAFKEFVEGEIIKIRNEINGVAKSADDRLGTLEKAGGVSQRIQGSETSVVTGQAPAGTTGTQVEKTSSAPRKPDQNNPWRGLFDPSVRQQLARRQA